nr:DUF1700 domain-containing protein [uncultured Acetatifactor sp.]
MNRIDFMKQLESLLQNISPAEREEALQYYNEYFNDAGAENEQNVIEALGNPAKVAENIKRDLYGSGYGDAAFQRSGANNRAVVQYHQNGQYANTQQNAKPVKEEKKMSSGMVALIVVLCVLASPVILGVGSGVLGVLLGMILTWFGLILGFGLTAVILFAVLLFLLVLGGMCLFTDPLVGIALFGGGLVCGGIGILFLMLTVAMAGVATPAICRGISGLFKKKA